MADNFSTPVSGVTGAADDIGGVHYQRVKVTLGGDGTNDGDVASGNPMPVTGTVAVTNAGLTELAAAIDTELQVDVVGALPAGTNNIGDVDILSIAAGDNNIGNVDVVTLPALAAGTNTIGGVRSGGREYETVAAGQTDQVLGASGAQGDYLETLICVVATAATSQVQIQDGNGSDITVLPNGVGGGVGTYVIPIGLTSVNGTSAGWKVTTAAGVSVLATGDFT